MTLGIQKRTYSVCGGFFNAEKHQHTFYVQSAKLQREAKNTLKHLYFTKNSSIKIIQKTTVNWLFRYFVNISTN